jgi:hypothetical protein
MQLTRNFSLQELIKSDTAIRKGIDNNPNADQVEKLKTLCEKILQPVRDQFGRVKVTSGYRSPELCVAIGSSLTSQHSRAEAVDFECLGVDNAEVADWVKMNCETDQLILEYYTPGEPQYPQQLYQHKLQVSFDLFYVLYPLTVISFQDHNY